MSSAREQEVELSSSPCFAHGAKVRALRQIRNDGTHPHCEIGDVLVRKGDVGYVRDIGAFLQRFYVYAVEFIDSKMVVGMRGYELVSADAADVGADAAVARSAGPRP